MHLNGATFPEIVLKFIPGWAWIHFRCFIALGGSPVGDCACWIPLKSLYWSCYHLCLSAIVPGKVRMCGAIHINWLIKWAAEGTRSSLHLCTCAFCWYWFSLGMNPHMAPACSLILIEVIYKSLIWFKLVSYFKKSTQVKNPEGM